MGALALVIVTIALTAWPAAVSGRDRCPPGCASSHSGLVMADPVRDARSPNRQLLDHYVFNGSAAPGVGWIEGHGPRLDVGVRSHAGWAGWFAVTLPAAGPDVVWHAVCRDPPLRSVDGVGEAVLAVQSASTQRNGSINYVVVSALVVARQEHVADRLGARLRGRRSHGSTVAGTSAHRRGTSTEPVTIRTDGHRSLAVWFGDRRGVLQPPSST